MKKFITIKLFFAVMLVALIIGCASGPQVKETAPPPDPGGVITDIQVRDNTVEITASRQFVYALYKAGDPYKITVDIPDMKAGSFTSRIVPDKSGITEIVPQQVDSPKPMARIEITLNSPSSAVPLYKDNTLTLVMKPDEPAAAESREVPRESDLPPPAKASLEDSASAKGEPPSGSEPPAREQTAPAVKATEITKVDIEKTGDGVKVLITGNGILMPNVFPVDNRIVIDVANVAMNASVPKSVISPLKAIRSGTHKDKVRLVLDLREKTKFDVAAVGSTIEISLRKKEAGAAQEVVREPVRERSREARKEAAREPVKEITAIPESAPGESGFSGKKISLDFQDAEIGPIFRLLADVNGYNLVLDPSVKGKITIKLMNVPWDQALDIILNTFNLGKSIEGNILWIAPVSTFSKIADEKSKAKEAAEKAEDLYQEVIRINYASASDVQSAITNGKLLSPRGTITPDQRMNTLIVKDTQKSIDRIRELVKIMDVAKPQVMIEAKLVQVSTNYTQTLGIRWGGNFTPSSFPNTLAGNFSVNTPVVAAGATTTNPGGVLGLTVGHANTVKVDLSLQALESISKAKTLSNPKVMTMDNEAANIQQGTTFYIPTVSQAGTQTQQQQATLSLSVTPKITPDGYVQIKVTATDNALEPGTAGANAVVDTKSITTQALIKNGETLVLGGIYTTTATESSDAVPILGRIPGLGWLFKTRNIIGPDVKELLIFITPTIVSQPTAAL